MRSQPIVKKFFALGLVAALAAVPFAQAAAQDHGSDSSHMKSEMKSDASAVKQKTSDTWITTKVKSEFATTKGVQATDISVSTMEGKVTLTGNVTSAAEKMKAKRVAMKVKGVKSVDTSGLTMAAK